MERFVRRIDDLGRIVIPKAIRRQLYGNTSTDGKPMEIFVEGDRIVIQAFDEDALKANKGE